MRNGQGADDPSVSDMFVNDVGSSSNSATRRFFETVRAPAPGPSSFLVERGKVVTNAVGLGAGDAPRFRFVG